MRQVEMPKGILKLLEGGIDVVLSGVETYRGENWHDKDNIAQNDDIILNLLSCGFRIVTAFTQPPFTFSLICKHYV